MVLSSWLQEPLREFTRFIWWISTERRVAANPQTMPVNLGCESADNWQLPSTFTIAIKGRFHQREFTLTVVYNLRSATNPFHQR